MIKIIADDSIPYVQHYFGHAGQLKLMPGREMSREDVRDADLLLVRSVTQVDARLLKASNVKWVGSVTAGSDHLDLPWLLDAKIAVSLAHGFNAQPVAEYVVSVIAALQEQGSLAQEKLSVGIVGVGATGRRVAHCCQLLGMTTVLCDPIRARHEKDFHTTSIHEFENLDLISLHVPLTYEGEDATYHLIHRDFIERQREHAVLINASRGAVIHESDLKKYGSHLQWCLDVYENEPRMDSEVLSAAKIATPHMAGYSLESKHRGIAMIYQAAVSGGWIADQSVQPISFPSLQLNNPSATTWQQVVLELFNPLVATQELKTHAPQDVSFFDRQRLTFNQRREFKSAVGSVLLSDEDNKILKGLGVKVY